LRSFGPNALASSPLVDAEQTFARERTERTERTERAMSEFAPPSYTGDPNMARCSEDYFKLGFWGLQIGLAINAVGGGRFCRLSPGVSGDTALALSEEVANRNREKSGRGRKTAAQVGDKIGNAYQRRALDFRRQNMM